jgi:hypothetical protein
MSSAVSAILGARPIRERVEGSPYQPGQSVLVVQAVDVDIYDVGEFVGRTGVVEHLEYECGCGQHYPGDPMVGVRFADGDLQEFWREELSLGTLRQLKNVG